jgi:small nuclear ribonucleoprotein E
MTQPINLIFRFLQSKSRIQFWLFEQKDMRIEGRIIGFDEYMNLVLDEAEEISLKKKTRKPLGDSSFRLQCKFLLYNSDFSLTHMITASWFLYFLQGGSC